MGHMGYIVVHCIDRIRSGFKLEPETEISYREIGRLFDIEPLITFSLSPILSCGMTISIPRDSGDYLFVLVTGVS